MQSALLQKSYSLNEFARQNDIGVTTVRGEIKAGRLVARKIGRRTIITPEDASDWRNRLPKVQPHEHYESLIVNGNSKAVQGAAAAAEPANEGEAEVGGR
jgi:hypothetical protein